MSSLRNSLHRRNHKERSQLSNRSRLGILEKHKDYVLRAKDYHSKQDRIQRLRQKAAERNKDEFYFGMNRQRTQGGVHIQDRGNSSLPIDMVKVLKSQDENYIRTVRAAGLKKIEKLKAQLSTLADLFSPGALEDGNKAEELNEEELDVLRKAKIIDVHQSSGKSQKNPKGHIIFVDSEQDARKYSVSSRETTNIHDKSDKKATNDDVHDLGWMLPEDTKGKKKRKLVVENVEEEVLSRQTAAQERRESAAAHRVRLLKELSARIARDTQLRYAERELEMQRLLMGKGAGKKLQGVERVGGEEEEDEDEDEMDARKGQKPSRKSVDEKLYKPRVYKWRAERKR